MAEVERVSAVAALSEPTRRRLYDFVVRQSSPVSRDDVAEATGTPRTTVAFHLDRLVDEGLLDVEHERRTGRSGPGAGRPAKLYRRSSSRITVSLPQRQYELAAMLLADAMTADEPSPEVLYRRAHETGRDIGRAARELGTGHDAAVRALEAFGFEPRADGAAIVLANCPFHELARVHTNLVCTMNLRLVCGMLHGLSGTGLSARLTTSGTDRGGHCCVRLDPSPTD